MNKDQLKLFMPKERTHLRFKGEVEIGKHHTNAFKIEQSRDKTTGESRDLTGLEGIVCGHVSEGGTQYIKARLVSSPDEYAILYFDTVDDLTTFKKVAEVIGTWDKPMPRRVW